MAGTININRKPVLNYSSGLLSDLYFEIESIIDFEEITYFEIIKFIEVLNAYRKAVCPYIEISDHIKTHKGVKILLYILEIVINNIIKKHIKESTVKDLWNFYSELMKYNKELGEIGK